ncbi:MAG: protein RarD [Candidatus Nephrothrix sp. EaCA]|nr:MAG: protein RarD [Candidatus Nephrothrix sp. EaCA]
MNHPETARGIALSVIASVLFALLSAYTRWLTPLNGLDIFAWRILSMLPLILILLVWHKQLKPLRNAALGLIRNPLQALRFAAMTAMLGVQLCLFLWAPLNGHALDVSLGYFLLPLVMVLIGRFYYGERLDVWQSLAVACAAVGVLHELWMTRAFSWPTVLVALGYPPYFMMRKRMQLDSMLSFAMEIFLLAPAALYLLSFSPNLDAVRQRPDMYLMLLPGLGLVSTIALECFLRAGRLLPMGLFGILSYVEPVLLVAVAVVLLDETLTAEKWLTYIPIWLSVGFTAVHSVRLTRKR